MQIELGQSDLVSAVGTHLKAQGVPAQVQNVEFKKKKGESVALVTIGANASNADKVEPFANK